MAEKKPKIIPAIILIVISLISGSVYVVQFGDVISYSDENRVVVFKDKLGLPVIGKEIARMKITSHKDLNKPIFVGIKNQRVIIIELEIEEDYKDALGIPKFINLKTGEIEELKYYWEKAVYGDVEIKDYEQVCELIKSINGSNDYQSCERVSIGTHTENKIIRWERLFTNDLPKGNLTLALVVFVKPNTSHDAVIYIFGKEIKGWAEWTNDLTNGIVVYYQLNETSGDAIEYFYGVQNGTPTSLTQGVAGKVGTAYEFTKANPSKIDILAINTDNTWSLSFWMKSSDIQSTNNKVIFNSDTNDMQVLIGENSGLLYTRAAASWRSTGVVLESGAWNHIVVTNNPNTDYKVYINNSEVYSVAGLSTSLNGNALIGTGFFQPTVNSYGGVTDEIGVWDRVLTPSERTQLYNNKNGITPPTPPVDTCTYTSGNWLVDCADNCIISSNVVGDASNLIINGTGKFTMDANISGFGKYILKGACNTYCQTGCFIN